MPRMIGGIVLKTILVVVISKSAVDLISEMNVYKTGYKELFTLVASQSRLLLDYPEEKYGKVEAFDSIQSVFTMRHFNSPSNLWLHTRVSDAKRAAESDASLRRADRQVTGKEGQITFMTIGQTYPRFMVKEHMRPFKQVEYDVPGLWVRGDPHDTVALNEKGLML